VIALGIETSGRTGSVALCDGTRLLAAHTFPEGARRARDIVPAIDRIMQEAGLPGDGVDLVAVSEGPGSFTGLRIGVTCAKTLAWTLGWKCVGVPSLEVLVQNVPGGDGLRWACPTRDARRDRVYGTVFAWRDGRWTDTTGVLLLPAAELAERISDGAAVFGTGARAYPEALGAERFRHAVPGWEAGRAEAVCRLGIERVRAGAGPDPMELMPRYYRLTEVEERLERTGR
jgi:tRNA threonylcarbamoyladenosine biosynthesis protein TsaB